MKHFEPNGEAWIATRIRYAGIAARFGKDPLEERIRLQPVRITNKLVCSSYVRFDRVTGHEKRSNFHCKPTRIIAYRLAGQEWELL